MTSLLAPPALVEIKNATYSVEPIPAGFAGTSAVQVTKMTTGEAYTVVRTHADVVECTCPDFVCRHEGKGTVCKHGASMVARGFLPPAPAAAVAPVTSADLKRAKFFKLTIPAAPLAPAPIVEPAKLPELSQASRLHMAEATAALITPDAIEALEAGDDDEAAAIFDRLDPENRESFASFLRLIGSPAATWSSWLALCRSGSPVSFPEPRPARAPRFVPTPELDAEWLGFELGNAGEDAAAPAGWDFPRLVGFYGGYLAGKAALEAERAEYHAWLDGLSDRDPADDWHHAEAAEAGGIFAARARP